MIIKGRSFQRLLVAFALVGALSLLMGGCGKKDKPSDESPEQEQVALAAESEDAIASGIRVGGVDIGGQSMQQARQTIQSTVDAKRAAMVVTLTDEGKTWMLTPDEMGLSADVQQTLTNAFAGGQGGAQDIPIVWKIDQTGLTARLEEIAIEINAEMTEPAARYTPEGPERFAFDEGKPGKSVDVAALNANIQGALQRGDAAPIVPVPTQQTQPTHTLEEVKANLVRIVVVNTSFSGNGSSARVTNLELGCQKINGSMIKPGREWSFNDVVGPRDREPWQKAATIVGGNTFEDDWGGGICQVSTTLYNAVLKADLKVSKRNKHSIPSSYVPYGLDATVAYGSKDFKFVNNTDYPVYIFANVDKNEQKVYVSIYGRPLPDNKSIKLRSTTLKETNPESAEVVHDYTSSPGSTKVLIKERKGYTVQVTKEYVVDGKVADTVELYTDTYAPVRGVVSVGATATSPDQGPVVPDPSIDQQIPDENVEQPTNPAEEIPEEETPAPPKKTKEPEEEIPDEETGGHSVEVLPDDDGAIDIPDDE